MNCNTMKQMSVMSYIRPMAFTTTTRRRAVTGGLDCNRPSGATKRNNRLFFVIQKHLKQVIRINNINKNNISLLYRDPNVRKHEIKFNYFLNERATALYNYVIFYYYTFFKLI